jgi:hypothetical protein
MDYVIGRREGKYSPQVRPPLRRSEDVLIHKIMAEIENDFAKKIANAVNPPTGDREYSSLAPYFRGKNYHKMYRDLLKDLQKDL